MRGWTLAWMMVAVACADPAGGASDGGSTFGESSTAPDDGQEGPSMSSAPMSSASSSSGPATMTTDADDGDTTSSTVVFDHPDWGWCDTFEQDCPRGEKCMLVSTDGDREWDAAQCVPVAADPAGKDEPCTIEGSAASGIDDCDAGLVCVDYDGDESGVCHAWCQGSPEGPLCDEGEYCPISDDGPLLWCVAACNPLAMECPVEEPLCVPINDAWACAPPGAGEGGTHNAPCTTVNGCDGQHVCVSSNAFSRCDGPGCCASLCDALAEDSDAMCAALDPNQTCEPWYLDDQAPPGYEHVGVCVIPG